MRPNWLALETAKVRTQLGVQPRWPLHEGIERTIDWYRRQHQGADACDLKETGTEGNREGNRDRPHFLRKCFNM
jgi:dTDP-D-glucose 4,6-dehydratase